MVIVLRSGRLEELEQRLLDQGIDLASAAKTGRYVGLEAKSTLAKLRVNGRLSLEKLRSLAAPLVADLGHESGGARIFGEMVALLCEEGNFDGAIQLEDFWGKVQRKHAFKLLCAYPQSVFADRTLTGPLLRVCDFHDRVIPSESYSNLSHPEDQQRQVVYLQQRASALESEIAERNLAEEKLKLAKEELEIQLEDLKRLQEMSLTLAGSFDVEKVLSKLLQATLEVHGADQGLLSVADSERKGLVVKVSHGFDDDVLSAISFIPSGSGACGHCFQQGQRVVIEDVEQAAVMKPFLDLTRRAGIRACHSTPLITRDGAIIGALSIYFGEVRRATEREKRMMDLYARAAADIIENAHLQSQLQ